MINLNVNVIGEISQEAKTITRKDGKTFSTITIKVRIPSSRPGMQGKNVFIKAVNPENSIDLSSFKPQERVRATGTMTLRKVDTKLYFNLKLSTLDKLPSFEGDKISGTMEFRGTIGKEVTCRTDKRKKPYVSFSAYSSEVVDEHVQYIWVRFIKFDYRKEDFLEPKAKIWANGDLDVLSYNDNIDLNCRFSEIKKWQWNGSSSKENSQKEASREESPKEETPKENSSQTSTPKEESSKESTPYESSKEENLEETQLIN